MADKITFKIPEEVKKELLNKAKEEERNLSEICRLLIRNYLRGKQDV